MHLRNKNAFPKKQIKYNYSTTYRQEGVTTGQAKILDVEVVSPKGAKLKCKAYQRTPKEIPKKPLPSPQYLDLIIRGTLQNGIPDDYVNKIKLIETNHNSEKVPAYEESMMRLFKPRK